MKTSETKESPSISDGVWGLPLLRSQESGGHRFDIVTTAWIAGRFPPRTFPTLPIQGDTALDAPLTILLPVYNAEAHLRQDVERLLEVAADFSQRIEVLIVDQASSDDSSEVARELATRFPQVRFERRAARGGLGTILRDATLADPHSLVVMHDGVSPIDADQLQRLCREQLESHDLSASDLRRPAKTHDAMAAAHRRIAGFHLASPSVVQEEIGPDETTIHPSHSLSKEGVGNIPPLPKPNYLDAITSFALGE